MGKNRACTPPRRPGDPGVKVDSNFVDDDWDEDSPIKTKSYNNNYNNRKNTDGTSNVQSDPNWLEEDFDDD